MSASSIAAWMPDELPTTGQLLNLAMRSLAQNKDTLFVGQSVAYPGWAYDSLDGVPMSQRVEFPVAEELQLGYCTGLSLKGYLPVCIFPRMDFMLRALDQLVNHLDKLEAMSRGQFNPKVIIRTRVGPREPLDAGPQHTQDHSEAFREMLERVEVVNLRKEANILETYRFAEYTDRSVIVVEDL